jgi:hypothetical protein
MNMRKFISIIFSILVLLPLILSSACVTQSSTSQSNPQDVGISQISPNAGSQYISFDAAQQNLLAYQPASSGGPAPLKTVYFVHGTDVNESGYAASWIFGVNISDRAELLAYGEGGWITIPWNLPLDSEEINFDEVVLPDRLFSQNHAVILGTLSQTPERRELDLKQGLYTLTITSGSTVRILVFSAITGELIP